MTVISHLSGPSVSASDNIGDAIPDGSGLITPRWSSCHSVQPAAHGSRHANATRRAFGLEPRHHIPASPRKSVPSEDIHGSREGRVNENSVPKAVSETNVPGGQRSGRVTRRAALADGTTHAF